MKKEINKKALILPLLILTILVINLVMVSAPDPVTPPATGVPQEWASAYIITPVKNFFTTYVIPNYNDLLGSSAPYNIWVIISLFGFLIFCSIIFEIIMLASPLSSWINILIGIFIILIFTLWGWFKNVTMWCMVWIVGLTGISGIFGMIMLGVIFLIGGIALFTGSSKLHKWILTIKYNKALTKASGKAFKKAANVNALTDLAGAVDKHKPQG